MKCRNCQSNLDYTLINLYNSPPSNSYLREYELNLPEVYYPLKVFVCESCYLVQVDEYKESHAIFNNEYAYFSSYSTSWLKHCKAYTELVSNRFNLNETNQVIEIASNDGYLLQYFKEKSIPVLGIEPTKNTAIVAVEKGIKTITEFFGTELAEQLSAKGTKADLLIGNNVLAHVPNILDFVQGLKVILNQEGVITLEFPHLLNMIELNQFDTIYHEHFSYLSLFSVKLIFEKFDLRIFDVEEIPTHGGSLRIYACHANAMHEQNKNVDAVFEKEIKAGINNLAFYKEFTQKSLQVKLDLISFLTQAHAEGKKVVAYGAAAKGNTLLNYAGVKSDLIDFVVDANPAKQNKFLPSSHIPVVNESHLKSSKADYVLILPWNLKDEILEQLSYVRDWGGKFVIPIPRLEVI